MPDGQHFSFLEQHFPSQQSSPLIQQVFPHFFAFGGQGTHFPGLPG
jgi:hypothetical protein